MTYRLKGWKHTSDLLHTLSRIKVELEKQKQKDNLVGVRHYQESINLFEEELFRRKTLEVEK